MAADDLTPTDALLWRARAPYTPTEAAALIFDKNPDALVFGLPPRLKSVVDDLWRRFGGRASDLDPRGAGGWIDLDMIADYAALAGLRPLILQDQLPTGGDHDTRLMRVARWVLETYSGNEQWPTRELVVEKLQDLHSLTKNEAQAVDTVTRPDRLRRR